MFETVSGNERYQFFNKNDGCHIPGYTGHCPTLKFQYGTSYGTRTKEILQDLKQKQIIGKPRPAYRYNNEHDRAVLQPIERTKGQTTDPASETRNRAPRYIIGYTGFIPTLNFRSGKSYSRTADDCMHEFSAKQRRVPEQQISKNKLRSLSAPKYKSVRNSDDVKYVLQTKRSDVDRFKIRDVSPECPPIAGYTGYIPKVKGNEESLSQRYNNVVKRSLTLLKEERDRHSKFLKSMYNDENSHR